MLDDAANALAAQTNDFSRFSRSVDLAGRANEAKTVIDIPVLEPWALLVVSPDKGASSQPVRFP